MSFDLFLLERGSKLSLITQEDLNPQPSFTITHATQLFMSLTITKISNSTCQKITASDQMKCFVDTIGKTILEDEAVSCLPFQIYDIFRGSNLDLPLCQDDIHSAMSAYMVVQTNYLCINHIHVNAKYFFSGYFGCHGTPTRYRLSHYV